MGLRQHGLSDGLIFLDRTSLPPPRMMEVLRCGLTLEQRLLASPTLYLTESTSLNDINIPFSLDFKRWGCGHLSLLTWIGTYGLGPMPQLQLRFVTQTHFTLSSTSLLTPHRRSLFNCAECHNSAFLLSRPLAAVELLESLTEPLVSTADSVMAVSI